MRGVEPRIDLFPVIASKPKFPDGEHATRARWPRILEHLERSHFFLGQDQGVCLVASTHYNGRWRHPRLL